MKKAFFLLSLVLATLIPNLASAQSIVGTWFTNDKSTFDMDEDETIDKMTFSLTFNSNGTATTQMEFDVISIDEDVRVVLSGKVSASGTYKKNGKMLILDIAKNVKPEITKVDFSLSEEMEEAYKAAGITKQDLMKTVKQSMDPSQITNGFDGMKGSLTVKTLTNSTLELDEDGSVIKLQRKR